MLRACSIHLDLEELCKSIPTTTYPEQTSVAVDCTLGLCLGNLLEPSIVVADALQAVTRDSAGDVSQMASTVHGPAYPQVPGIFPRHDHPSSLNGSYPQPAYHSFDASQSVASTPAATPPPPRAPSQQSMAYSMNGGPVMHALPPGSSNSFGGYPDPNGYAQQQYYTNGMKPQIYTAVYSSVSVYEMEVNGVAVMRRRSDSWLNATQILKVAGVEKGKRTKVLEKEILVGKHEKVQGGYGKYQGTWIDYVRGREFCRQYGVEELLRPLLEHDLDQDGINGMQPSHETPTKEQALAAQRKSMYNTSGSRPMTQSSNGTFFKNMSSTAVNAVQALNRTRYDSPGRSMEGRRSAGPRRASQQPTASQESMYPGGSQQSLHSLTSQDSFSGNVQHGSSFGYGANFADFPNTDAQEPPRKRPRYTSQNSFNNNLDPGLELSMRDGSPTEPNDSFISQQNQSFMAEGVFGLEPLPPPRSAMELEHKQLLMDLFIESSRTDFDDDPAFLTLSGEELEITIDESNNTALHWAAALARIPLVRQLLKKGVNINRTNSGGETALIAACKVRNNHDYNTFSELLELLGPIIEVRDSRGRTLLHHIAVTSAMKARAGMGRYYLESLLEFVVHSSASSSQEQAYHGSGSSQRQQNTISLGRFMSEVVNAQDKSGDTALNLAARTGTRVIIDQLIEVGADPHIGNHGGLAPTDFGVANEVKDQSQGAYMASMDGTGNGVNSSQASFAEAQNDLVRCEFSPLLTY